MSERNLNFEQGVDRKGTRCLKYDFAVQRGRSADILPLWVADMDFKTSSYIQDALLRQAEHGVYGYTEADETYFDAVRSWMERRHGWKIEPEWLLKTPGVVFALAMAVKAYTEPGDYVLIQEPVYYPFREVIESNDREVANNVLYQDENGSYKINFEDFERQIVEKRIRLFILCSPHNPVSRVWTREELEQIAEICYESKTLVISDEIHADLTLPPYQHITFALVSEKARQNSLVFMSPSKAFNMPGLASSYCIIENKEICRCFQEYMEASELSEGHLFAYLSVAAAYSNGTEWLDQVLAYIQSNIDFTDAFLSEYIPNIKMIRPQASYLVFLDCRTLGLNQKELVDLFVDGAHLALNDGTMFGKEGEGFMRLNVACPRSMLEKALKQLKEACDNR